MPSDRKFGHKRSSYIAFLLQCGAQDDYRKQMRFVKPESIEFPSHTFIEKVRWKLLVAVKITQVRKGRMHNPHDPLSAIFRIVEPPFTYLCHFNCH